MPWLEEATAFFIHTLMKNHWIDLYERKKNRWLTIEFMRNGMFLLKPRRGKVQSGVLGPDSDVKTEISVILQFDPADNELLNFVNEAQQSMSNIYSHVRLMQGIYPVLIEVENYELTALTYGNILPAGKFTLVNFIFYFEHMRYMKIQ